MDSNKTVSPEEAKRLLDEAFMKHPNVPIVGKKGQAPPPGAVPTVPIPFLTLVKDFSVTEGDESFIATFKQIKEAAVGTVWETGEFNAEYIKTGRLVIRLIKIMDDLVMAAHGLLPADKDEKPKIDMCLYQIPEAPMPEDNVNAVKGN